MDALAQQLAQRDGTLEFKIDADDLAAATADDPVVNVEAADRDSVVQVYAEDDAVVYEYVHVETGRALCSVSLDDWDEFTRFHVFLTWSPTEAALYIGPHPSREGVELRRDTTRVSE